MRGIVARMSSDPPARPNPLIHFLETITPQEEAALAYLAERDREDPGEPDDTDLAELDEALAALKRGEGIPWEVVNERLRQRLGDDEPDR